MEQAVEHARKANVGYFKSLEADQLCALAKRRDEDGRTLLHTAAAAGSLELTTLLAEAGGMQLVDAQDDEGWSPLHSSVSGGHEAVVQYLITLGAPTTAVTSSGLTPLHHASSKGRTQLVRLLLQHGANVAAQDKVGATPLHRAAALGRLECMRVLLAAGGRGLLRLRDRSGATPLFVAVSGGQGDAALLLAAEGSDVEAETNDKETPLSAAGPLREALLKAAQGGSAMDEEEA